MGWSTGTSIFDAVVRQVLALNVDDDEKKMVIIPLIEALTDQDWDGESESDYWDHPLVRACFKEVLPDWDWEDIESNDD